MGSEADQNERAHFSRLMRALQRTIEDAGAPERIALDARGWLLGIGIAPADASALAAAGEKRMLIYRKLVRRGLADAIQIQIPRTRARLESAWEPYIARYFSEELPRSHYLRDVAVEFVGWALPRWALDTALPPYLCDLARHELFAFEVGMALDAPPQASSETLSLDRPVRFHSSARLKRYDWAIHRLNEDTDARDVPPHEPTALLGYRDADHEVRYLELTPLAAAILERLLDHEPLGQAVVEANGGPPAPVVLENVARLLADLGDRGVMLGAD